ncbi:MAG: MBL fold metallo-hydrolase [Parcubacteria group bacterium]
MSRLTCFGGVDTVTGANFMLEIGEKKVLVDCGLTQGTRESGEINRSDFAYDPVSVDILFVTHAHIDHIGRIPKLVKDGFRGEIWSTPETLKIAGLMLEDSARINERNAREEGQESIYTSYDVERSLALWKTIGYHEPKEFGGFSVEFFDAGHILGSSMIKFTASERGESIMFTGDLGNSPSVLLKDTEKVSGISYMVMESVYGDRNHEGREEREEKFKQVVLDTIARKGTLLIPAFSLERTQVVLHLLDDLVEGGMMKPVPVFLDSPLAIKVTDVYTQFTAHYNKHIEKELGEGDDVFGFSRLKETAEARDSREIRKVPGPKIILAGSGMSTAGRIVHHEEEFLPDKETTLLFMGYQAPGTLGRQIQDGAKNVEINGRRVQVRARIENISGFSAHADSDQLVDFVSNTAESLKKVFVAMGEPKSSIFLSQRLRDELGVEAVVPEEGRTYELDL